MSGQCQTLRQSSPLPIDGLYPRGGYNDEVISKETKQHMIYCFAYKLRSNSDGLRGSRVPESRPRLLTRGIRDLRPISMTRRFSFSLFLFESISFSHFLIVRRVHLHISGLFQQRRQDEKCFRVATTLNHFLMSLLAR